MVSKHYNDFHHFWWTFKTCKRSSLLFQTDMQTDGCPPLTQAEMVLEYKESRIGMFIHGAPCGWSRTEECDRDWEEPPTFGAYCTIQRLGAPPQHDG